MRRFDDGSTMLIARAALTAVAVVAAACRPATSSAPSPTVASSTSSPSSAVSDPNRGCQLPVSQRTSDAGCWLTVEIPLGLVSESVLFWHLYRYPTAAAAQGARGPRGVVTQSFDTHWVFTIAVRDWQPATGERVAVVGPLEIRSGTTYAARYMEAVFPPGYRTGMGHRHSGTEAWYVLTGAQCLETPEGIITARAGETAMVPAGPPMAIAGVGSETRRSVLPVLHPTEAPWVSVAGDWRPRGLCPP